MAADLLPDDMPPGDDGFLVLARAGDDGDAIVAALARAGSPARLADEAALRLMIAGGSAGACVVTEAALLAMDVDGLVAALADRAVKGDIIVIAVDTGTAAARIDRIAAATTLLPLRSLEDDHILAGIVRAARRWLGARPLVPPPISPPDRPAAPARSAAADVLQDSPERNRFTIELSDLIVFTTDPQGVMTSIDERYYVLTGQSHGIERSAGGPKERAHPDDRDRIRTLQAHAIATGTALNYEYRGQVADGSYRWWQFRAGPVRDADGTILRWYGTLLDIDDRKQAEARLRASEELYGYSIALSNLIVWTADADANMVSIDNPFFDQRDPHRDALIGRPWDRRFIHPDDRDRVAPLRDAALARLLPVGYDIRIAGANGEYRWWRMRAKARVNDSGSDHVWYGTLEDVHDLKIAEQRLRDSEERHRYTLELSNQVILTTNASGTITALGDNWQQLTGIAPDLVRATVLDPNFVHPDDLGWLHEMYRAAQTSGTATDAVFRLRRPGHDYRYWRIRAAPRRDASGAILGWYSTLEDVDELKRAEARLRETQEIYRYTVELGRHVIITAAPDGQITSISDRWTEMTGIPVAAMIGAGMFGFLHPDDRAMAVDGWLHRVSEGVWADHACRIANADGSYRWWHIRAAPRCAEDGTIIGWYGTLLDIDDMKRAEADAREADAGYRYTIELIGQIPWTATPAGETVTVNFGLPLVMPGSADPVPTEVMEVHPDDLPRITANRRLSWATGQPVDHIYRLRVPGGDYFWMRSRGAPRRDAEGRIIRWYGTLENVDAAKRAELEFEQLRREMVHLSRLNAMGTMASTLAHELNQPLAAAINYITGSQRLLSQGEGAHNDRILGAITNAERCAVRASEIIRKLRDLVSGNSTSRQSEDVGRLIGDACSIALINTTELGIAWRIDLDPAITNVLVDGIQIQQVIINLLRNAVDAVVGTMRREIVIATTVRDGFWAVKISDSGPGVTADMEGRMFESFQTTKAHGTGIGLSISRTIAEAHGGQIHYEPSDLGGAAFTLVLPLVDAVA